MGLMITMREQEIDQQTGKGGEKDRKGYCNT